MTTSAEHGSMAEVGSPVDIPPDAIDRENARDWTSIAIAVAALFLLVFNAHAIGGWFDELTPSPVTEKIGPPVDAIVAATQPLDGPRAGLAATWDEAKAARFGNEQSGEEGADSEGE